MSATSDEAQFGQLLLSLQRQRGFDFTGYKRPSLMRRFARRMQLAGTATYDGYRDYLEAHPEEFAQLFNTILINVTSFFRDPAAWEFLAKEVLPPLLEAKRGREPVRAWSAGCASGEEAYTVAMVLCELMGAQEFSARAKVYATDVDEDALAEARLATYGAKSMEGIDPELRRKYFEPAGTRWQFRGDLRRSVIFGRHDLVQDAPISRLDLLVCRNALMYLNAETQARVLSRFHFALNGDGKGNGILFLGRAEMLLTHGNLFSPIDLKHRVFAKVPPAGFRARPPAVPPAANGAAADGELMAREDKLRELALEESPVARIVVDASGNVALANQRARLLFSLNPRDIGRPLQDLEISYRPVELRSMIEQAYAERRTVTQTSVERRFPNGEVQYLDVSVSPLIGEAQRPAGVGVTFFDVTRYTLLQEELRSSREEVQTTNEELQSTNEELETMNEELQSTNEELQTVNAELRQRTNELDTSNAFLNAVLASLRFAAIVVDRSMNVMMWNHRAEDLWGLRAEEVKGKSFLNLDIGLPVGELRAPVRACLMGEADHRETVVAAVNRRGKSVKCRVTCTPLLTAPDRRDGVILMMEEE